MKTTRSLTLVIALVAAISFSSCHEKTKAETTEQQETAEHTESKDEHAVPEYFLLRPEVEKAYGYSHAVKIGNSIKVSGAVSMDDQGNPTAVGNLEQQMKNCYADLQKVLAHYGCTFNDVVVENVFTTNMPKFLEVAGYRNEITKITFQQGLGLVSKNWQSQNL